MEDIIEEYFELSDSEETDINNIKLPYILKDKVLMSPGVWNSFYYGADEIKDAFSRTDWNSKENRSLFLDHKDDRSSEWIGEVLNPKLNGDDVIGDLIVVDRDTAIKLAYGAKMGISPKVHGGSEGNAMRYFTFDNFSVVINPAVKTAWINNSENFDLEQINEFIDLYKSFIEAEDTLNKLSDYTDFVKKIVKENPELPIANAIKKAVQEWKKQKQGGEKMEEIKEEPKVEVKNEEVKTQNNELAEIKTMFETLMNEFKEFKEKYPYPDKEKEKMQDGEEEKKKKEEEIKKKEEYPYPYKEKQMEEEKVVKEMSSEIDKLKEQVNVLTIKLNEPDKVSVKQELSEDADTQLLGILQGIY